MLTTTQKRYIDICVASIASVETNEALAERFSVGRTLVDRAIRWGREHDLFALDTTAKLRGHLLDLRVKLGKLDRAFLAMERQYRRSLREDKPAEARAGIRVMALLSERILGFQTRIMELEGIYKHVLNIQHGGGITLRSEPDFTKVSDEELNQLEAVSQRIYGAN